MRSTPLTSIASGSVLHLHFDPSGGRRAQSESFRAARRIDRADDVVAAGGAVRQPAQAWIESVVWRYWGNQVMLSSGTLILVVVAFTSPHWSPSMFTARSDQE
jgi:hypothetical protein